MSYKSQTRLLKVKVRNGAIYNFELSADTTPEQRKVYRERMKIWIERTLLTQPGQALKKQQLKF